MQRLPETILLAALLAIGVSAASSAEPSQDDTLLGGWQLEAEVELGGRSTWGDDKAGKFLEYRDLDSGVVGAYRIVLDDSSGRYFFRSAGENLGYDDQRYWLEGGRYGRFKIESFYRELPHVFSTQARGLYSRRGGDTYRLPGGVQSRIAGAANQSSQLATELLASRSKGLGLRWLEGGGGAEVQWTDSTRLYANYRLQDKNGTRARAMAWGTPGGHFVVLPLKVNEKIHEVRAGAEWSGEERNLSIEYLGSFFENELDRALVDNPLVATDTATASTRGRQALAPDNSAHSVALFGSAPLPLPVPARVTGNVVYGVRLQDQRFLPHTVNPAITSPALALPQGDLDGRVNTVLANFRLNVDPHPKLDLDVRYRLYRYDNDSDELVFPGHVTNDDSLSTSARRSVANDYTVHKARIDGRYRFARSLTGHLDYSWDYWNRSDDRQVKHLHEHGPTTKLDYRFSRSTTVLASYAFRTRNGSRYDPFGYFDETLDAQGRADARNFGESRRLRKFDQANRHTHRFDVQARSMYRDRLELTFSGGVYLAQYRDSDMGLTRERTWNVGSEVFYQLHPRISLRGYSEFESIRYEQDSRWRPRSFFVLPPGQIMAVDSALNDWSSQSSSHFSTSGVRVDAIVVPEWVDLGVGYEFHYGSERTTSSGTAGFVAAAPPTTSGDGGSAANFPEIEERLHTFSTDLALRVNERVSILAQYRFEFFDLDRDYHRQGLGPFLPNSNVNGSGAISPSTDVFLRNNTRDYRAHLFRLVARIRL